MMTSLILLLLLGYFLGKRIGRRSCRLIVLVTTQMPPPELSSEVKGGSKICNSRNFTPAG